MADTTAKHSNSSPSTSGALPDTVIESVQIVLEAYVGSARMTIAELRQLKREDVLALDHQLNQAIELRLNGLAIARGEVVAVGEHFGVRLTEVVS